MKNFLTTKLSRRFTIGFFTFLILSFIFFPISMMPYSWFIEHLGLTWNIGSLPLFALISGIIGGILWFLISRLPSLVEKLPTSPRIKNNLTKPLKVKISKSFKIGFLAGFIISLFSIVVPHLRAPAFYLIGKMVEFICKGDEGCIEMTVLLFTFPIMFFSFILYGMLGGLIGYIIGKIKARRKI